MEGCFFFFLQHMGCKEFIPANCFYVNQNKPHRAASSQCDPEVTNLGMWTLLPAPGVKSGTTRGLWDAGPTLPSSFLKRERGLSFGSCTKATSPSPHHPPPPPFLLKSQHRPEHTITRVMRPRAHSQHRCWWSHSKLGWSVHRLNLPINSLCHQKQHSQADKPGSREKGVSR